MNVSADKVREQIRSILNAWGMEAGLVETTVEAMVETDLSGVDSHGISMLMDYERSSQKGKLNLAARPKIVRQNAVTALIDADAGLGHPAAVMGMNLAIEKALAMGVGVVSVFNSHHFGAAGYYAALAPKRGLIGLVTSGTRTINTVPTRGTVPVLGTNPIAFAAPAKRNRPFLLDMATATVAQNKVKVYDLNNKRLPTGWVVDERGEAMTDASEAIRMLADRKAGEGGGLTPIGGAPELGSHKGYGLGMMAHILGGALSGASFSPVRVKTQQPKDPDNIGHFFMAIDPKAFREEGAFEEDLDIAIDILRGTPAANPDEPVLVHGDPEAKSREKRLREGIPIPEKLGTQIRAICERSGVPYLLR